TFVIDMSLQNYGSVDASGLTIDVTTSNPNVVISYNELLLASMSAQSVIDMNGLVTIELNNNFADQELVNLIFTITDAEGTQWITNNSFLVNAPELEFSSHSLSNSNSTIALGETVELTFVLNNIGHAPSTNGSVVVSSDINALSIDQNNLLFSSIGASLQALVTVPVTLDPDAPLGETYSISLTALSDAGLSTNYTATFTTPNCSTESSEVQINLVTDYYPNETSWVLLNSDGETIGQLGSDDLESGQSYTDIFCTKMNAYYTFEIQDDFGDGLLSGGYSIVICGETIASGADFGDGETINFISGCDQTLAVGCTDPLYTNYSIDAVVDDGSCESLIIGLTELENRIRIYPNPAKSKLNIQLGSLEVASISVFQMEGKQIREYTDLAHAELEINISDLDAGFYHIKVKLQSGQTISKSIIVM
ncbi:T9SS type A sorting domain-containing protein, partial [bacterium]|nr:T9SS type A sorting domain-containing protein [bacterium]